MTITRSLEGMMGYKSYDHSIELAKPKKKARKNEDIFFHLAVPGAFNGHIYQVG